MQKRIHAELMLVLFAPSACSQQNNPTARQLSRAEAHANVIEEADRENLDVIRFDDKKAAVRTRDNLVCSGKVRLRDRKTKREGATVYFSNDTYGADLGSNIGHLLRGGLQGRYARWELSTSRNQASHNEIVPSGSAHRY